MSDLTMGVDYARVIYGDDARHVPAWFYVQDQGAGVVAFVGASVLPADLAHPLRYGSDRTHQIIVGEIIVRPHTVVATDELRGAGLGALATGAFDGDIGGISARGDVIIGRGFDAEGRTRR